LSLPAVLEDLAGDHRLDLVAAGQGEEHDVARLDDATHRLGDGGALALRVGAGGRVDVEHGDRRAAAPQQVAAHRPAHDTEADEAERRRGHVAASPFAAAAAFSPAIRPNTAPRTRPAPPG